MHIHKLKVEIELPELLGLPRLDMDAVSADLQKALGPDEKGRDLSRRALVCLGTIIGAKLMQTIWELTDVQLNKIIDFDFAGKAGDRARALAGLHSRPLRFPPARLPKSPSKTT